MLRLKLSLPCPVNRLWRAQTFPIQLKTGRTVWKSTNRLSQTARNREKLLIAEIHDQLGGKPEPMTGPVLVQGVFHPRRNKNKALPDADAYTKHLLDCLKSAGVYVDDKQVAASPMLERLQPKARGSMEIEIWELQ